jgi:hypothetical protein
MQAVGTIGVTFSKLAVSTTGRTDQAVCIATASTVVMSCSCVTKPLRQGSGWAPS